MAKLTKEQIIKKLDKIYSMLDEIQESDILQEEDGDDEDTAIWNIGEAMGCIDNAIDIINEKEGR